MTRLFNSAPFREGSHIHTASRRRLTNGSDGSSSDRTLCDVLRGMSNRLDIPVDWKQMNACYLRVLLFPIHGGLLVLVVPEAHIQQDVPLRTRLSPPVIPQASLL